MYVCMYVMCRHGRHGRHGRHVDHGRHGRYGRMYIVHGMNVIDRLASFFSFIMISNGVKCIPSNGWKGIEGLALLLAEARWRPSKEREVGGALTTRAGRNSLKSVVIIGFTY